MCLRGLFLAKYLVYKLLSMGILSSIVGSKDDLVKPNKKSYWGLSFDVSLTSAEYYRNKKNLSSTEKRMLRFDLSDKEPIEDVVVLTNSNKKLGRFTTEQVKEMLDDMGFNVNPTFGGNHFADIIAVMNVGGFSIPGWVRIARLISKVLPSREKMLIAKLSPGKDRLHIIAYEANDGSWVFACHTDYNWLSLNLPRVYKAHVGHGAGDYITGTLMFYSLLKEFAKSVDNNKILSFTKIQWLIQDAYNRSLVKKFGAQTSSKMAIL